MLKIKENSKMNKELVITILIGVIVALGLALTTVHKLQAEIITLEEKLANTESANEVLVEQLKQIIGGR